MLLEDIELLEDAVDKRLGLSLLSSALKFVKLEGLVVVKMIGTNYVK